MCLRRGDADCCFIWWPRDSFHQNYHLHPRGRVVQTHEYHHSPEEYSTLLDATSYDTQLVESALKNTFYRRWSSRFIEPINDLGKTGKISCGALESPDIPGDPQRLGPFSQAGYLHYKHGFTLLLQAWPLTHMLLYQTIHFTEKNISK